VRLRGALHGAPLLLPSTLFILPDTCRPAFRQRLPVVTEDGRGILEVRASGEVVLVAGGGNEVRLDGVSFEAGDRA
jgi:hypothetical protein